MVVESDNVPLTIHKSTAAAAPMAGAGAGAGGGKTAGPGPSYGGCPRMDDPATEESPGSVTQLDAYFAIVKGNLGPGVLALPFAFSQAGWGAGLPVLFLVVAQGVYAMLVLAECKRAVAKSGVEDLGDMAYTALGRFGRHAADIFVFIVQSGVCVCFVNLVAGNLIELTGLLNRKAMTFLLAPFFSLLALLRFVAQLGFLNKLGTIAMVVAVVTGTVCGASRLFEVGGETFLKRAAPTRPFMDSVILASSVFFAFEGLGIVLPIEKEMREPARFAKVAMLASMTLAVAFVCVAFTCGIAYRGQLQSGSIVAFLAEQPGQGAGHTFVQVADILVTAAVFLTYPLQLLPAAEILSKWLCCSEKEQAKATCTAGTEDAAAAEEGQARPSAVGFQFLPPWVLIRLVLVAGSVIVALTVDNVTLLVSLFGAVGQTGLGMLSPLCHLALMRSGMLPKSTFRTVVNVVVVLFCAVIMVCGTYFAFLDILSAW